MVKPELGGEARRAKHAHRIFAIAQVGVADQSHGLVFEILHAADVVAHAEVEMS
jgi:hypothetical protein